jgi:hypothetical protein
MLTLSSEAKGKRARENIKNNSFQDIGYQEMKESNPSEMKNKQGLS